MDSIPVAHHQDPAWAAFDAIDAAVAVLFESEASRRCTGEHAEFLRRVQRIVNRLPALGHREITAMRRTATPAELGTTLQQALADLLHISPGEANRRVNDAEQLGPRTALSGEPMEPWLAHTAAAQAQGAITVEHVKVIRTFVSKMPNHFSQPARDAAERELVAYARGVRPDELRAFARDLRQRLDQDGDFKDEIRARRRGMTVGPPDEDGMRRVSGWLDPEAGATWDAVNASWAAPGMCNPADESPCVDQPTEEAAQRDGRTQAQRNHDAFKAVGRAILISGKLGVHKGLPATIIVSTTLAELEAKAGVARTAGGTLLPMKDLLRLARHASHYLAIYGDKGEILHLGRTKRTANAAQRIVLHDRDRGCTRPGCTVPGYGAEAHHATRDWADGGLTNVDDLAFACPRDNKLVKKGGWQTRKNIFGETEWIPPPHLDTGQPRVNTFHHPERVRGRSGSPPRLFGTEGGAET